MIGILKTLAATDKSKLNTTDRLLVVAIYTMTNQDGIAWPGIPFLAKITGIEVRAVQKRLRILEGLGVIEKAPRFNEHGRQTSNEYRFKEDVLQDTPVFQDRGTPSSRTPSPLSPGTPPSNEGTKKEGSKRRRPGEAAALALQVQEIYEAYPRKVGPKAAVRAIEKALKDVDPDLLLERVKAYAASVQGKEKKFVPHPQTWFNQGRWEDEDLVNAKAPTKFSETIASRLNFLIGHRIQVVSDRITQTEIDRLLELMPHDLVVNGDQVAATAYDNRISGAGFYRPGWIAWRKEHPHLLLDK